MADQHWPRVPLVKTGASPVSLRNWLLAIFWSSFLEILKFGFWLNWNNHQINSSKRDTHTVQFPLVSMIVRDESTVLNYHCKREPNILYRFPKYSAQIVLLEEKLVSLHVIHLIQFISLIVPFVCLNFEHAKQFDLW